MKHMIRANNRQIGAHFYGKQLTPDAIPLVLLHGFCEDSSLWDAFASLLKEIPVVAIDLPGFGQSDLPESPQIATYARAVEAVLDALDVPRCVLAGHSLGGYVALEFAARRGDRLAGMALFHSHPFPDNEERISIRRRGIDMLRSGKRDLYVSQLFPNLFTQRFAQAHPDVVNALIASGKKQPAEGIAAALEAMIDRSDHQKTLKTSSCPVLFLLGEEDALVPVQQGWQAALLPDIADVVVLAGVAHMGMFESSAESAAALQSFYEWSISRNGTAPGGRPRHTTGRQ